MNKLVNQARAALKRNRVVIISIYENRDYSSPTQIEAADISEAIECISYYYQFEDTDIEVS